MLEQYDNRYNNILIDLPLRDTAELVLKFILPLSSFLPSPLPLTVTLTLINNSFIPLLHVSTLTIERDSELVKLSVLDTILTLSNRRFAHDSAPQLRHLMCSNSV